MNYELLKIILILKPRYVFFQIYTFCRYTTSIPEKQRPPRSFVNTEKPPQQQQHYNPHQYQQQQQHNPYTNPSIPRSLFIKLNSELNFKKKR